MSSVFFFILAALIVWFVISEHLAGRSTPKLRTLNVVTCILAAAHLVAVSVGADA